MRRFAISMAAVGIVATVISLVTLAVLAPPSPSTLPMPISQYGVAVVFANQMFQTPSAVMNIKVTSNGYGAFFVVKLLIFMNTPGQSDLVLDSMNIDGFYAISFSNYYGSPKIVVVASGSTNGEVVSSLPTYLTSLLMKDPLGNQAIVLNGGTGNGLTVGLRFSSETAGGLISAEAIVTAPSNNTITITMS